MLPDFNARLTGMADVIIRIGLNLQPDQRILIAEPYELQGVARSAEVLVNAVHAAALRAGAPEAPLDVLWGDPARLRSIIGHGDWPALSQLAKSNARRMERAIQSGDALLFLQGSQPRVFEGLPADAIAEAHRRAWEHFGPVSRQLMAGAANWTVAPAPSPAWATAAFEFLPASERLTALWNTVFQALRCAPSPTSPDGAVERWRTHLDQLSARRDALNAARWSRLHYHGDGTDLTVRLPAGHTWCTAQLVTTTGVPFVANLPTEEIFTAPEPDSAQGRLRVARPILHNGAVIEGVELEFDAGDVVAAEASRGGELLQRLLETDDGSRRLGEVALVESAPDWSGAAPLFRHVLLDENAAPHVALGDAYAFCTPGLKRSVNPSFIHLDLPIAARAELS